MGCFDVQYSIEMAFRKLKRLCVADAKVNAKSTVCFATEGDRTRILIDAGIGRWLVITLYKGCAASMTATDLKNILVHQLPRARHVMIQLNGRPINFIFRFERDGFAFGRPVAVVQERDRIVAD